MSDPVVYEPNSIGADVFMGHFVLIREHNVIGNSVSIGSYTEIAHHVTVHDDVRIHSMCFIPEGTIIEKGAWLGPRVTICNDHYPQTGGNRRAAIICEGAIIGAGAVILDGVVIGAKAIVGAGSVVTKNVEPGTVVWGNPATCRKTRADIGAYRDSVS